MPIVSCPGCGHGISDRATACVNCGRALTPVAAPSEPVAPPVTPTNDHAPGGGTPRSDGAQLPFFSVATHKFVIMCVVTLGMYQYYWLYKQWKRLARTSFEPISPFWRTFFAPLWGFSLFMRIRARAELEKVVVSWNDIALGVAYLLLSAAWRLPEPWWIVSLFGFLPLLPVHGTIEEINARHSAGPLPNRSFSGANVLGIFVGGGILVLALIGTFMKP